MRKYLIGAVVGVLVLALAGIALAATNNGASFDLNYSTKKAATSTGFSAAIDTTGTADASGRPKASRRVTITFEHGTKFDTSVRPRCTVATLRAEGPNGCPARSKVGEGDAEAVTGASFIDPVPLKVLAYNATNKIIFHVSSKPEARVQVPPIILEGTLRGRKLTVPVPKVPNTLVPYGEAILTKFSVKVARGSTGRGARKKNYATSPATCPRGTWTTTAVFTQDAGSTTVRDTSRCTRTRSRR